MLLQFPSIAALSVLSFTSHALALSAGHARLHRHPQAQRLEGRFVARSDAPSVQVPVNLIHLLRTETAAFQEWMGAWLGAENSADSGSSVALLKQEIQAYEGWINAWLDAATSTDAPTAIPPPPSVPVTVPTPPASRSQVLSTSHANPLTTSRLNLPKVSSSTPSFSSTTSLPLAAEFLEVHESVIPPAQTSFLTVTSRNSSGVPSSIPPPPPFSIPLSAPFSASSLAPSAPSVAPAQTPSTVTPVPVISGASFEPPPRSGESKGFNALSHQNLAVYYGQTPATAQVGLGDLCQNKNVDIVVLAFLTEFFGPGGFPTINFGAACGGQTPEMESAGASGLLNCPDLASQISLCQNTGKKVLLSLGGSVATSAFASDDQASKFATTLWDLFGAGTGVDPGLRPFGSVKIDGFDVGKSSGPRSVIIIYLSRQTTRTTAHRATAPLYPPFAPP